MNARENYMHLLDNGSLHTKATQNGVSKISKLKKTVTFQIPKTQNFFS